MSPRPPGPPLHPHAPFTLTSQGLHVLHRHAQHRQLVQFAGHGVAGGHQRRQLVDEAVHLVPAPLLNLAVGLSAGGGGAPDVS